MLQYRLGGGGLEEQINHRFNKIVKVVGIPSPNLTFGSKSVIDVIRILFYSISFIKYWKYFSKHDVWHINSSRLLLPLGFAGLFFNKKIYFHVHLDHHWYEKLIILVMLRLGVFTKVICCSGFVLSRLAQYSNYFKRSQKCVAVVNSLTYEMEALGFDNRFNVGVPYWNIAVIGWIAKSKGQDLVSELPKRFPFVRLYFIGDIAPGEEEFYCSLKGDAGSQVSFVGHVVDVSTVIRDLKIHCSIVPSRVEESFGLVAIESMANSCITFSTPMGGLKDIAEYSGHFLFSNKNDLINTFEHLTSLSCLELEIVARSQYENCKKHYSNERFDVEMLNVLTGS